MVRFSNRSYIGGLYDLLGCGVMAFFSFKAFFDESYAKDADANALDRPYLVAGFVSSARDWKAFERDWKHLLRRERLPYFHAAECEGGFGPFSHLRDESMRPERDRLQRVFIDAINRHRLYGTPPA